MANYFSIFLVFLTISSGLIWLVDSLMFASKRRERMAIAAGAGGATTALEQDAQLPWLVDTAQQIFPVIAFVLVLRSFLYEPFQIPSGSMMPTLLVGDFILVEKFTYGLKDPVMRKKFVDIGEPERGDRRFRQCGLACEGMAVATPAGLYARHCVCQHHCWWAV